MVEYLSKVHALLHDFSELLPLASTPSQEPHQRSKFFMLLALHGLPNVYSQVCDHILRPQLCLILLPLVPPFCVCQVSQSLIYLLSPLWYLRMIITITLAS